MDEHYNHSHRGVPHKHLVRYFRDNIAIVVGLVLILFAYYFAEKHFIYYEQIVKKGDIKQLVDVEDNWRNKLVAKLNFLSFLVIILGIVAFVYFSYLTISNYNPFNI